MIVKPETLRLALIVAPLTQSLSKTAVSDAPGTEAPVFVLQALLIVEDQLAVLLVLAPSVAPTQYRLAANAGDVVRRRRDRVESKENNTFLVVG